MRVHDSCCMVGHDTNPCVFVVVIKLRVLRLTATCHEPPTCSLTASLGGGSHTAVKPSRLISCTYAWTIAHMSVTARLVTAHTCSVTAHKRSVMADTRTACLCHALGVCNVLSLGWQRSARTQLCCRNHTDLSLCNHILTTACDLPGQPRPCTRTACTTPN